MLIWQINLLILLGFACGSQSQARNYSDQEAWKINYPKCNGTRQSPIAINMRETTPKSYPAIKFSNYDDTLNVAIMNNGHTAEIEYPEDSMKPQITGGPLENNARYQLSNVHFHWGANDTVGAEHVINGQQNSMEVHVVHYNLKYGSVREATQHPDGIAVLAVFYRANPNQRLAGLDSVTDALPETIEDGDVTEVMNFQLSALIGGPRQQIFYTYPGSLTTPDCSEAVTWIIYPKPILVKSEQLEPFRNLLDTDGNPLVDNFRKLQKRNGRKIYQGRNKRTFPLLPLNIQL